RGASGAAWRIRPGAAHTGSAVAESRSAGAREAAEELKPDYRAATGKLFRASNKQQYVCRCVGATTPDPGPGGPGRPGIVLAADRPAPRPGLPARGRDAGGPGPG